jgi:hypothetical protein
VLFSKKEVAGFINLHFEASWQSVRPAPIVRIDFGNGNVVTRTLHGNIATYVCSAQGNVLDVLPGIYEPDAYVQQLDQFRLLPGYLKDKDAGDAPLKTYHQKQAELLKDKKERAVLVEARGASILAVESSVKLVLEPQSRLAIRNHVPPKAADKAALPELTSQEELASWKLLHDDTRTNESARRQRIHTMLAELGDVPPAKITKRLYKEVLNTDLDDPYLGLGKTLFSAYPFAAEDGVKPPAP